MELLWIRKGTVRRVGWRALAGFATLLVCLVVGSLLMAQDIYRVDTSQRMLQTSCRVLMSVSKWRRRCGLPIPSYQY